MLHRYRLLIDPLFFRYGAAGLILVAGLLAFLVTLQILNERQIILNRMKEFGERFVSEFEAPLFRYPARRPNVRDGHPVRSRLRFSLRRERMEILLAPLNGRTYPNLSDHRKNLEYDIERVHPRCRESAVQDRKALRGRTLGRHTVFASKFESK